MQTPEKKALEKIQSLENLEDMLTVVSIKGWSLLLFFILLIASIFVWSIVGVIPITTSGQSITLDPSHSFALRSDTTAIVSQVLKSEREKVQKNEPLIVLKNEELSRKIMGMQNRLAQLEKSGDQNEHELFLLRQSLTDLQAQEKALTIRSPVDGSIVWVDAFVGDQVLPQDLLVTVQGKVSAETLKIFAFIPLKSGQAIKPQMKALCSLNAFNSQKYGVIRAKVQTVMPYPMSADEYFMQKIPSKRLKELLLGKDNVLVILQPDLDPNTDSGLRWTSENGPPSQIEPLLLGNAQIVLEEIKPITYVIPRLGK